MQRVFSAGTFTTIKIKTAIKDVCRVHRVSVGTANYITSIIDNDKMSWTDFMRLAAKNKRIMDFVENYPDVVEEILPLMEQTRSAGIHASAVIITPEYVNGKKVDCFDLLPVRKMDGLLVSEISGYDIDAIGILKNDVLGIAELTRLSDMFDIIAEEYESRHTMLGIITNYTDEKSVNAVMDMLSKGYTQGVFQMSGQGITRFIKEMRPETINDLIALVALFRPGPLDTGAAQDYVDIKNGNKEATYLWGTYDTLKNTYGQIVYQEQIAELARKIGGLSLGDGVNLVKAISKKKIEKVNKFKARFFEGADKNGCPKEAAEEIWNSAEKFASYAFNHCIAGSESFYGKNTNVGKNHVRKINIRDMYWTMHSLKYAKENNRIPLRSKLLRQGYGKAWSLSNDNRLHPNEIVDIRYMGIRNVYKITLENGKTIRLTDNHKSPTQNGDKRTDELVIGVDSLYCTDGYEKEDTNYKFTDKGKLNNKRYHSNERVEHYLLNSCKGHEGFTTRSTNYTQLKYYIRNLKKDYCECCGKKGGRLEVHHINGDHSDVGRNFSNLITVCPSCHKKLHYKMGRCKRGEKGHPTYLSKIVSIELDGVEDVYDVEVAAPWHTFANQNGIVTHNSHATAYGLTAYVGAWLKVNYPMAFYSVILRDIDDDKLPIVMSEIRNYGKIELVSPDINASETNFTPSFRENKIYWSLSRIKWVGYKAVQNIILERRIYGNFIDLEDFIKRIFKQRKEDVAKKFDRNPVNIRCVKNLILSGAFDKCNNLTDIRQRYDLLQQAYTLLNGDFSSVDITEEEKGKPYYWTKKQIELCGIGNIDYEAIWNSISTARPTTSMPFIDFSILDSSTLMLKKGYMCATIADVTESSFISSFDGSRKRFGKIKLQQNTETAELTIWGKVWQDNKDIILKQEGKIIAASVNIMWDEYKKLNSLKITNNGFLKVID